MTYGGPYMLPAAEADNVRAQLKRVQDLLTDKPVCSLAHYLKQHEIALANLLHHQEACAKHVRDSVEQLIKDHRLNAITGPEVIEYCLVTGVTDVVGAAKELRKYINTVHP